MLRMVGMGRGSTSPGSPDQDRCVLGLLTSWDHHVVMVRVEEQASSLAAPPSLYPVTAEAALLALARGTGWTKGFCGSQKSSREKGL